MKPALLIAALATLSLGACQQPKSEPTAENNAAASAAATPDAKPGIQLSEGRLVLPAVAGNPGAAYFQINNSAGANTVISAISINGAVKTEVHQTVGDTMTKVDSVEIAPSTSIKFEPGALHVMVFELSSALKPGATTELTVTFADGDKVSAPLKIEAAGGAGMGGMEH